MKKSVGRHVLFALSLLGMVTLASCGGTSSSSSTPTSSGGSTSVGGFSFAPQRTSSTSTGTSSTSTSVELDIEVLADINADGEYVVEAELCDTSGCTLQAGCASFFEQPGDSFPTSGGECIACIASPSILAFQFNAQEECDITFYTVSAKYENPWNLDANVNYYIDEEDPFVTGYTEFGHTDENQWYNWKTVEIGTAHVTAGVHQFNIKVLGAFPNTDCFNLAVTNYGVAADTEA